MKTLTTGQITRLEEALGRIDTLTEIRPPSIQNEVELAAIIHLANTVADMLAAGQTVYLSAANEAGHSVALAQFRLEPAPQ